MTLHGEVSGVRPAFTIAAMMMATMTAPWRDHRASGRARMQQRDQSPRRLVGSVAAEPRPESPSGGGLCGTLDGKDPVISVGAGSR